MNLLPNSQKGGGLTGPQFLEGVAGRVGVKNQEGLQLLHEK